MKKKGIKLIGKNTYEAIEFSEFNLLFVNRPVNKTAVKGIKESIKKYGNISTGLVAIVNGILYILDGQHRFTACKELTAEGHPVTFDFKLVKLDNLNDVIKFVSKVNSTSRNWGMNDYIQGHANDNKKEYKNFLELMDMAKYTVEVEVERQGKPHMRVYNKSVGQSVMLSLLEQNNKAVKNGEMVIGDMEQQKTKLNNFLELSTIINPTAQAQRAIGRIVNESSYEHEVMLDVVKNGQGTWANTEEKKLGQQLKLALFNFC